MLRRRLVLSYSGSDDEDEEGRPQPPQPPNPNPLKDDGVEDFEGDIQGQAQTSINGFNTVTLTSPTPNQNPRLNEPLTIDISDDEFMELADHTRLQPPQPSPSFQAATAVQISDSVLAGSSYCPVSDVLRRVGLSLRREWLDSLIRSLDGSVPGFGSFDAARKAKMCFERFLFSDMNCSGGGVLPENVASIHDADLAGPFVLQVDEIVNISCPLRYRYQPALSGLKRCLKLSMTDGVQQVFGMEYRPIKDLEVFSPAGLKVVVCNVNVRNGHLMLVPEVFNVLGGMVEKLEAARQRLVLEVNKPPRGKGKRNGVLASLANRATLAAWPTDGVSVSNLNDFTSQDANPLQRDGGDIVANESHNSMFQSTNCSEEGAAMPASAADTRIAEVTVSISRDYIKQLDNNPRFNLASDHGGGIQRVDDAEAPFIRSGDKDTPFTYLASLSAKWAAVEENEPFVTGTIKCFLTGVKGFQYKQRTNYDLRVYVDDGSLISEIVIDHTVVQKGIGHSPEEVTAALSSSERKRVTDMRETLRQFQIFLVNFEGTMRIEINKTSPLPVALQMDQGCPPCDGWLLLRRLKSLTSSQMLPLEHLNLIDVLP